MRKTYYAYQSGKTSNLYWILLGIPEELIW